MWICAGGAAGTLVRYALSDWTARTWGTAFPYGTLTVNIIGSLLLGVVMAIGTETTTFNPTLRMALSTGVLGGFTTYSAFSYETMRLWGSGGWRAGSLNVLLQVLGGLLACAMGWIGVRAMLAV